MCEDALTVTRQLKPAKATKKSKIPKSNRRARRTVFHYSEKFAKKYGVNGRPTNVFRDYEPPSARMRLRDAEGKELRNNAEKSTLINEYY